MCPVLQPLSLLPVTKRTEFTVRAGLWHQVLGHVGKELLMAASDAGIGVPAIELYDLK